jgi:hypothetical protein
MALLLALSMHGLAASGHFPQQHRAPSLQSAPGVLVLFGTIVIAIVCFAVGIMVAWRYIPWYAAIIGGGGVILVAPLALHAMPDRFVNSAAALIVFSGASLLLTVTMTWIAIAGSAA